MDVRRRYLRAGVVPVKSILAAVCTLTAAGWAVWSIAGAVEAPDRRTTPGPVTAAGWEPLESETSANTPEAQGIVPAEAWSDEEGDAAYDFVAASGDAAPEASTQIASAAAKALGQIASGAARANEFRRDISALLTPILAGDAAGFAEAAGPGAGTVASSLLAVINGVIGEAAVDPDAVRVTRVDPEDEAIAFLFDEAPEKPSLQMGFIVSRERRQNADGSEGPETQMITGTLTPSGAFGGRSPEDLVPPVYAVTFPTAGKPGTNKPADQHARLLVAWSPSTSSYELVCVQLQSSDPAMIKRVTRVAQDLKSKREAESAGGGA